MIEIGPQLADVLKGTITMMVIVLCFYIYARNI